MKCPGTWALKAQACAFELVIFLFLISYINILFDFFNYFFNFIHQYFILFYFYITFDHPFLIITFLIFCFIF
jgi:hypothetical protein